MAASTHLDSEVSSIFAHFSNDVKTIRFLHDQGEDARAVVREMTDATDTFILRLFLHFLQISQKRDEPPKHILLLAQGGYGRRELNPKSDIDIIFLHSKSLQPEDEELIKLTFRALYDLGFQVGHAIRGYKEAIDIAVSDTEIQTALSETRFLVGDWRLFEEFKQDFWRALRKRRHEYIRKKAEEREERLKRHGMTLNITEPNIKESPGGLRDYHFGQWIGSLHLGRTTNLVQLKRLQLIDDIMAQQIDDALRFLWKIRNDLHFHFDKEQDVLLMELQHNLAQRLGYQDARGRLAEELMMRDYYQHALTLRRFAEHMIRRTARKPWRSYFRIISNLALSDGFSLKDGFLNIPPNIHFFEHNPRRIIQAFIYLAQNNATLSEETVGMIHDNLELIDQAFLHDKLCTDAIRKFFNLPYGIEKALQEMRRTGVLERIFPEWKHIAFLVRYDLVHRYTVDEHSLLCLHHLENLLEDRFQYSNERFKLWYRCEEKDVLRLAALFHDIGKGKEGDHCLIGARMVDTIARRLRLTETKRKLLVMLVENHLFMSRTAQRRDLSDPNVVSEFTDGLDRLEHLNLLYLLTFVDMRSVSPESMTEWKNHLLWQLYRASRNLFITQMEDHDDEEESLEISRKEAIVHSLSSQFEPGFVRKHLNNLPASYEMNRPETIRQHLAAIQSFDGQTPVTRFYPHVDPVCREMVMACNDRVGLFHRICAAVAVENFSIAEARLHTRKDGIVANNIVIRDAIGNEPISEQRQTLLQERIQASVVSDKPIQLIQSTRKKKLGRSTVKNRIKVLNDVSARHTVLEVLCADRHGLLQDLTGIISSQNISIHFARIITEGERVLDIFYIAGPTGDKIHEEEMIEKLKLSLEQFLNDG